MQIMQLISDKLIALLAPCADPERVPAMQAYMLNQFTFLGIGATARRAAIAPLLSSLKGANSTELLACAAHAWQLPEREYHYAAIDILARHWKALSLGDIDALLALAKQKPWWDSVDGLAGVVGDVLKAATLRGEDGHGRMDRAVQSDTMWERRVAMLHQLGWRDATDAGRLFRYAKTLAHEKEFFIRKAIGWALRDYARHDPAAVTAFLRAERGTLSPLTVREAGKHLAIAWEETP
jgi:3-methyladenine DNA glycosylase AlkD